MMWPAQSAADTSAGARNRTLRRRSRAPGEAPRALVIAQRSSFRAMLSVSGPQSLLPSASRASWLRIKASGSDPMYLPPTYTSQAGLGERARWAANAGEARAAMSAAAKMVFVVMGSLLSRLWRTRPHALLLCPQDRPLPDERM